MEEENVGSGKPRQQELPFTTVPNIFLDSWVNMLGLVEIRIVAAILRRTFGHRFRDDGRWAHREETEPLSVSQLSTITRRSRPLVIKALARLRGFGIVTGSRISRQEALTYGLIMRPEFLELKEAPPPAKQKALPYDVHDFSSKETLTTEALPSADLKLVEKPASGKETLTTEIGSVVKETLPLSGKESLTTDGSVLRSIKEERRSGESHTPRAGETRPVENIAARQRVCGSKFPKPLIRQYAYASHNFDNFVNQYWLARNRKDQVVMGIRNPEGWAKVALRDGEHDDEIQEWVDDPEIFSPERFRSANRGVGS